MSSIDLTMGVQTPVCAVRGAGCGTLRAVRYALYIALAPAMASTASAQDTFRVFVRGTAVGSEQIGLTRTAEGWTISGSGQVGPPLDIVTRRLQVRYDADWKPLGLTIDGTVRGQRFSLQTTVAEAAATSHIVNGGQVGDKTDTIAADALLLPSPFFAPYTAVAERLKDAAAGAALHAYVPGQGSLEITVGESTTEQIQTVSGLVVARRTAITLAVPNMPLAAEVWGDANGRLLRLTVPAQTLDVVREDLASVSSRRVTISRPNDEQVKFGSNGVTLAGTLSKPAAAADGRLAAVVLVGGSGAQDRDSELFGIPVLGQIADAIANAGFAVLRYDKRGVGQSGGRAQILGEIGERSRLHAAVKWLADRKDIDPKRIVAAGYSEGGAVALLAAEKDRRIAAVALLDTPGVSGSELVLAQQRHVLEHSTLGEDEKQQRIELQKRINEAVATGKGLDQLPPGIRRQVDNPEFESLLTYDPAKVVPKVRQPILIVQGKLDTQVDPSNADRLEALAKGRKNGGPVQVARIPGVNHLLAPAATGEADEYASLKEKHVSTAVTAAIVGWLTATFTAR